MLSLTVINYFAEKFNLPLSGIILLGINSSASMIQLNKHDDGVSLDYKKKNHTLKSS